MLLKKELQYTEWNLIIQACLVPTYHENEQLR